MSSTSNRSAYLFAALPCVVTAGDFALLRGQTWLDQLLFDTYPQHRCAGATLSAGFFCRDAEVAIVGLLLLAGPILIAFGLRSLNRTLGLGWLAFAVAHAAFGAFALVSGMPLRTSFGVWGKIYLCTVFGALMFAVFIGTRTIDRVWPRACNIVAQLVSAFLWHAAFIGALIVDGGIGY